MKTERHGFLVVADKKDEEVIVSITGVLVDACLPPYKDKAR